MHIHNANTITPKYRNAILEDMQTSLRPRALIKIFGLTDRQVQCYFYSKRSNILHIRNTVVANEDEYVEAVGVACYKAEWCWP